MNLLHFYLSYPYSCYVKDLLKIIGIFLFLRKNVKKVIFTNIKKFLQNLSAILKTWILQLKLMRIGIRNLELGGSSRSRLKTGFILFEKIWQPFLLDRIFAARSLP